MIISELKAIYNPLSRDLAVLYGTAISRYTFTDLCEWTKVSYNGDISHPNYLHIQLDYDEDCQLLFYPRKDKDDSLHEDEGTYFNTGNCVDSRFVDVPENIIIVLNDSEFQKQLDILQRNSGAIIVEVPKGL